MNIHFIGFGNMARAIAKGLQQQDYGKLSASSPSLNEGVDSGVTTYHDNVVGCNSADVVILAVKPQQVPLVLNEIKPHYQGLIISLAAGIPFAQLGQQDQAVIRAMPNTPASIGLGATALCANQYCSEEEKEIAQTIFTAVGIVEWVSQEELLNVATALSGSGPAYFLVMMEAIAEAATELGLPQDTAMRLAKQTALGTSTMAINQEVAELRHKVTSKGGTTQAALDSLAQNNFKQIMNKALTAANARSNELAKLF